MNVIVLAVGDRMPDWVETATTEYCKRLSGDVRLEVQSVPLPKRNRAPVNTLVDQEARALIKRMEKFPGSLKVALEVKGRAIGSEKLAQRLGSLRDLGQDLILLVGGPDGLCPELSRQCDEQWSLSALTLPHPLVRIILAEQVYRAWTLLTGHPYHR